MHILTVLKRTAELLSSLNFEVLLPKTVVILLALQWRVTLISAALSHSYRMAICF